MERGVKAPPVMWVGGGWAGGGGDGRPQDRINRIRVMASVSLSPFQAVGVRWPTDRHAN